MSKDIPSSKDWAEKEQEVMLEILQNKYQQNPELADKLIKTGQRQLHEATGDNKWSTGAELASKALLNSEWTGQDLMGKLLETVRSDLLTNQQDGQSSHLTLNISQSNNLDLDDITPLPEDNSNTSTVTSPTPPPRNSRPLRAAKAKLTSSQSKKSGIFNC